MYDDTPVRYPLEMSHELLLLPIHYCAYAQRSIRGL